MTRLEVLADIAWNIGLVLSSAGEALERGDSEAATVKLLQAQALASGLAQAARDGDRAMRWAVRISDDEADALRAMYYGGT